MGFWGILVKWEHPVTVSFRNFPQRRLQITRATLEERKDATHENISDMSKLYCQDGFSSAIPVCSLIKEKPMCKLKLVLTGAEDAVFSVTGPHDIAVSGFYLEDPPISTAFSPINFPDGAVEEIGAREQPSLQLLRTDGHQLRAIAGSSKENKHVRCRESVSSDKTSKNSVGLVDLAVVGGHETLRQPEEAFKLPCTFEESSWHNIYIQMCAEQPDKSQCTTTQVLSKEVEESAGQVTACNNDKGSEKQTSSLPVEENGCLRKLDFSCLKEKTRKEEITNLIPTVNVDNNVRVSVPLSDTVDESDGQVAVTSNDNKDGEMVEISLDDKDNTAIDINKLSPNPPSVENNDGQCSKKNRRRSRNRKTNVEKLKHVPVSEKKAKEVNDNVIEVTSARNKAEGGDSQLVDEKVVKPKRKRRRRRNGTLNSADLPKAAIVRTLVPMVDVSQKTASPSKTDGIVDGEESNNMKNGFIPSLDDHKQKHVGQKKKPEEQSVAADEAPTQSNNIESRQPCEIAQLVMPSECEDGSNKRRRVRSYEYGTLEKKSHLEMKVVQSASVDASLGGIGKRITRKSVRVTFETDQANINGDLVRKGKQKSREGVLDATLATGGDDLAGKGKGKTKNMRIDEEASPEDYDMMVGLIKGVEVTFPWAFYRNTNYAYGIAIPGTCKEIDHGADMTREDLKGQRNPAVEPKEQDNAAVRDIPRMTICALPAPALRNVPAPRPKCNPRK